MRPLRIADAHKIECSYCYGHGCAACLNRGWYESEEGRAEREAEEDRRADEARERRLLGDD